MRPMHDNFDGMVPKGTRLRLIGRCGDLYEAQAMHFPARPRVHEAKVRVLERNKANRVPRLYRPPPVERAPDWLPPVSPTSAQHLMFNPSRPVLPPAPAAQGVTTP